MAHALAPGVDVVTFWLDERIGGGGTGVCIALFCHGYEILRFDCFGDDLGHFHITPLTPWSIWGGDERRLRFRERSVHDQIERCLFELTANLDFYLQLNPRRCVRQSRIDHEDRVRVCNAVRRRLHDHLESVPALQSLRAPG
jgi:hypothetical protein